MRLRARPVHRFTMKLEGLAGATIFEDPLRSHITLSVLATIPVLGLARWHVAQGQRFKSSQEKPPS